MARQYESHTVAALVGVPHSTLCRWAHAGLVEPTGRAVQGSPWMWSERNVREVSVIGALRRAALSLTKIREVMKYLRGLGHNPFSSGEFLLVRRRHGEPRGLVKLCGSGEAIELLPKLGRGQLVLSLWTPDEH